MDTQNLLKRIEELEKQVQSLNQSSTITYQVDNSFQGRGFIKSISVESLDPLAIDTLNTLVPTPIGDFPVIAFPIRWIKLSSTLSGGANFYIPAYTLFE